MKTSFSLRLFLLQTAVLFALVALTMPALAQKTMEFTSLMPKGELKWTENGKAQSGWVKYGGQATYELDGAEIVGRRGPGDNTFLCTEKKYRNFIFKCETKFDIGTNSGIQFRSNLRKDGNTVFGYQYESTPDAGGNNAFVYDESRRNTWLNTVDDAAKARSVEPFKKDDWNELAIQCVGPSIKTWINGKLVADFFDLEDSEGFIGLQVHSGPQGQVRWRNVQIAELPDTPWIPLFADGKFRDVEKKPAGTWEIQEDGSVYATTPQGEARDGMLMSTASYKNFAVKVSFKKVSGNSGLYFRAADVDKSYWLKGFQCEIEEGGVCSGLWEVEGRGWVAKNEDVASKLYKADDWNEVGTVAVGDRLVTFLNSRVVVDIDDPKCAKEGKTGLQLHGGGNQGYYFRDYWIMPLADDEETAIK